MLYLVSASQRFDRHLSFELLTGGNGLGVHLHSSMWEVWPFWGWPGHFGVTLKCLRSTFHHTFFSEIFQCKCFVFPLFVLKL